jgi:hypothetical protein
LAALNFGVNRNVNLGNSFSLSYGLGIDLFNFSFENTLQVLDLRIINEYETIKESTYTPGVTIVTSVNSEIKKGFEGSHLFLNMFNYKMIFLIFYQCILN